MSREQELKEAKLEAEIAKIEAEKKKLEAELSALDRRAREWESSADEHHHYTFYGEVAKPTVRECMADLATWSRRQDGCPITILFNSPGGSVTDGLALYDFIQEIRTQGHEVTTIGLGVVASMGGILLQAGDIRVMGRNAHMLIHELSSISVGKVSEAEDDIAFSKKLHDKLLTILSERSTMTKAQIKRKWERKDWWLSAHECLDLGFVDRVR